MAVTRQETAKKRLRNQLGHLIKVQDFSVVFAQRRREARGAYRACSDNKWQKILAAEEDRN